MIKADPIIAVKDVEASSEWYQSAFGCRSAHGGNEFEILVSENNDVLLCLHKWGAHNHLTMTSTEDAGNGLILYFRTENMEQIRENLKKMDYDVEEEIQMSSNSRRREFSLRDPDGYYITIAEFHHYEG